MVAIKFSYALYRMDNMTIKEGSPILSLWPYTVEDFVVAVQGIGILLGLLVSFLTVLELASRLKQRHQAWKRSHDIIGLVLTPTAEELAKYSAQLPQRVEPEDPGNKPFKPAFNSTEYFAERRMFILALAFFTFFVALAIRFIFIAIT